MSLTTTRPSLPSLQMSRRILLGPGPSAVHPRVMAALSAPVIGHLDPEFLAMMDDLRKLLQYAFQTTNELTISIPGTGSAAMEASIGSVVEAGDPVLICVNGYFGGRMAEVARRHGADVHVIERPWGEVFEPEEVSAALTSRRAKVVGIVHGETSTGALQPLEEISDVVHSADAIIIVDAVASLGAVPIHVDQVGIDICYSGSQKCLGSPPGLGPVTVGPGARTRLATRRSPASTWYLDLTLLQEYWGIEHKYHHTAPVNLDFALYEALRMLTEESLEGAWARHHANAELLWGGLEELGLQLHVAAPNRLVSLTTVRVPDGVDDAVTRRRLLTEYGIEIAGGLGELKGRVWRIGLMGDSSRKENVLLLLGALEHLLKRS